MRYVFRPGTDISGDIKHCEDGYTEVRRNGKVVGVYKTSLLRVPPA